MGQILESCNFVNVLKVTFLYVLNLDIIFAKARSADEANISAYCSNLRCLSYITSKYLYLETTFNDFVGGHSGRVVTLLPPTSEAGVQFPARPQVGKLVVACRWSAVYSTEP